jgi:hypothetical protein
MTESTRLQPCRGSPPRDGPPRIPPALTGAPPPTGEPSDFASFLAVTPWNPPRERIVEAAGHGIGREMREWLKDVQIFWHREI